MNPFRFINFIFCSILLCAGSAAHADQFNFRFSPLGLLGGMANLALDYKISERLSVGPQFIYTNIQLDKLGVLDDLKVKGSAFAIESVYSFTSTFSDGWYASAGIGSSGVDVSARNKNTGESLSATASGLNLTLSGGYKWFWKSFNMNLGLVVSRSSNTQIEIRDSNGTVSESYAADAGAGIDFRTGFTF